MLGFGDFFERVYQVVKSWRPKGKYRVEEQYQDDLYRFLREELNRPGPFTMVPFQRVKVKKEVHGIDIEVEGRIGIELKKDLTSKKEVDRLVGQIRTTYLKRYPYVLIVLCGRCDPAKVDDVYDEFEGYFYSDLLQPNKPVVRVVEVKREKPRKREDLFGPFGPLL